MNKLLVILGPTNVGKTAFAVELAQKIDGRIVSADSRQVYREMSIGTAKPTAKELHQAQHFLIDIVGPDEPFTLADFQQRAYESIDEIIASGKHPILVGGTGLYIQAVVDGLKIPKVAPDNGFREMLEGLSSEALVERLEKLDPDSIRKIPPENKRRLIRAIEVSTATGQPFSVLGRQYSRQFDVLQIGLTASREVLYQRADDGVDQWLKDGWIEEVKKLKEKYQAALPSMSSIGYREIIQFLDGRISLEEAVRRVKFARHAYIRRQMTWFRRDGRIEWFDTTMEDWQEQVEKAIRSWYAERNETSD